MTTALLKNYENHLIETQPDDYRKSLEKRWDKLGTTNIYMMSLTRSIEGEDDKHFQKLRKVIEKKVGYKIKKSYGSLTIIDYENYIFLDAKNEEERVKRETLFTYIQGSETHRKKWANIICSKFYSILPNAKCKKLEEHLSPILTLGLGVKPFGDKDFFDASVDFNIPYTPIQRKLSNICINGMRVEKKWNYNYKLKEKIWTEKEYLKMISQKLESLENMFLEDIQSNSININDFLSFYPDIEKDIADEVSRKLKSKRKQVKVSMSFDFDLSMTVDLDCLDEKDMKEKIEKILEKGLENSKISISQKMRYGDDFISILDTDCKKSMDYQLLETSVSTSTDRYEDLVERDNWWLC